MARRIEDQGKGMKDATKGREVGDRREVGLARARGPRRHGGGESGGRQWRWRRWNKS